MSQELHDKIFEETGGISQEMFLAYQKGELPPEQMHQVEKVLIDSPFEAEAMEGFEANSSTTAALPELNAKIEKMASPASNNKAVVRFLVAASLIGVIVSIVFISDYKNTLQEQKLVENISPAKPEVSEKTETLNNKQQNESDAEVLDELNDNTTTMYQPTQAEIPVGSSANEQAIIQTEIASGEAEPIEEITFDVAEMEESIAMEDNEMDNDMDYGISTESKNYPAAPKERKELAKSIDSRLSTIKDDYKLAENESVTRSRASNKAKKSVAESAPAFGGAVSQDERFVTVKGNDYKVSSVPDAYEPAIDKTIEEKQKQEAVPAKYESKEDMNAEGMLDDEEITVTKTYEQILKEGIKQYDAGQYAASITTFDIVLLNYPKDANAEFYKGQALFRQQKDAKALDSFEKVIANSDKTFHQEAAWYRALALINLGENKKAIKALEDIADGNGFYANQAKNKLKKLK